MSAYDHLSEAELSLLISELQEVRRRKRGEVPRSALERMTHPDTKDFMGSGLSIQEYLISGEIERHQAAYWRQSREEKSRRRDAVVNLTALYLQITKQTQQATMWPREAIVGVLNGDWKDVRACRDMLTQHGEDLGLTPELKAIFAPFIKLLDEVLAGVPKDEVPAAQGAASC